MLFQLTCTFSIGVSYFWDNSKGRLAISDNQKEPEPSAQKTPQKPASVCTHRKQKEFTFSSQPQARSQASANDAATPPPP